MKKLFALSLLIFLVNCEPIPRIKVSGGNPPTFTISRTPAAYFKICCEKESEPQNDRNNAWQIRIHSEAKFPLEIVYGILPPGTTQDYPEGDKPVSPLVEGRQYKYEGASVYGADTGCFQIQDGKAIAVKCDYPSPPLDITLKEGGSSPSFTIHGLDRVYSLFIYTNINTIDREDVWFIKPDIEHQPKLPVNITYGTLPEGYTQIDPPDNRKPQMLKPGVKYTFILEGIYRQIEGCFELVNNKIVQVECR